MRQRRGYAENAPSMQDIPAPGCSLSHYLLGVIHAMWCGISFVNSETVVRKQQTLKSYQFIKLCSLTPSAYLLDHAASLA